MILATASKRRALPGATAFTDASTAQRIQMKGLTEAMRYPTRKRPVMERLWVVLHARSFGWWPRCGVLAPRFRRLVLGALGMLSHMT